jgi:Zn-dependent protease/CBS domain-containing protein
VGSPAKEGALRGFRGFRLGRAFGVELEVDWSLLIIFALVVVNLAIGLFPSWHPDWRAWLSWTVALAAAVLFFGSVLVHEMSHALMARRFDVPVKRITLFLFGGVAHMDEEPRAPKAELLIAIVGPVTSIFIGIAALLLGGALAPVDVAPAADPTRVAELLAALGPLATLFVWLGQVNILLGVFNMVPGFPLDGGRVLRAALWAATKDLRKATRWSSYAGRGFAWFLMASGVLLAFQGALGGIWLVLIGWFLNNAAAASYQQLVMREAFAGMKASELMTKNLRSLRPTVTVDELVREHLMEGEQRSFPIMEGERLLGLVCLEDVRRAPRAKWTETPIREVMTPAKALVSIGPHDEAERALKLLAETGYDQLPVLEQGRFLGLVQRRAVMRWIAMTEEGEGAHSAPPRAARA